MGSTGEVLLDIEQLSFDGCQGQLQVLAVTFVFSGLDVLQHSGSRQEEGRFL